ncbi:PTB-containing, cubilin and LRP1-interacting protein [Engraulis encrasicolus]|uniref:PTB-containing, cubilin and LRP1-interacting protein n=1 Tax=Engraulis encrasicolus TaxID=184585 RepID=UPI002FD2B4CA
MWQPATERLQHFQTMLKTKLNVLTLRKDPLPTVIYHEPEAIELCSTAPHAKNRNHTGFKVTYLGKVSISGTHFLSGCTESAVVGLCAAAANAAANGNKQSTTTTAISNGNSIPDSNANGNANDNSNTTTTSTGGGLVHGSNAVLEIRPFQVRLHHLDPRASSGGGGGGGVGGGGGGGGCGGLEVSSATSMDTYQVARIAYCTADHQANPNVFAWIYRQINDDLTFQMDCHAVECQSKREAKMLAHSMMEAFRKTFHSMHSEGQLAHNQSSSSSSRPGGDGGSSSGGSAASSCDDQPEDCSLSIATTPDDSTPEDG